MPMSATSPAGPGVTVMVSTSAPVRSSTQMFALDPNAKDDA